MLENEKKRNEEKGRRYIMIKIKPCFPKCRTRELLDQNQ